MSSSSRAATGRCGGDRTAARSPNTFRALAEAIDTAFARWDRSYLIVFELADGTYVCGPIRSPDPIEGSVFAGATRLSRRRAAALHLRHGR